MPYEDGTGPMGYGPRTGRGMGPCGGGLRFGTGRGYGRGFGARRFISTKNEMSALEAEEQALKDELAAVQEEKKALAKESK